MKKVELLAPAGSMEALHAAVQSGCDAVYLGGVMFGARAYANNFNQEEMIAAIEYAHGYGVKVYVTMNTLLFEHEIDQAFQYATFLYEQGVDALIIQDLGLFDLLHQSYPDLELHASTQMHIHNEASILFMKEAGMKRIVLPRETDLEEIKRYSNLGIETEVFVQGALCISYSGQCLMSAKQFARSGNRGECAQMCRMKYRLGNENGYIDSAGEYLLSPKDLNTLERVPELIDAGITSFKIEGRMKRPQYVAVMTSLYRKAIDAHFEGKRYDASKAIEDMRKIFNRGFTIGHIFHQKGSRLINTMRPNHMGIEIGTVLNKKGKRVTIQLFQSLSQHDGIRFLCPKEDIGCMVNKLYVDGLLQNHADANTIVEIEVSGPIPKGTIVVKTSDIYQLEGIQTWIEQRPRTVKITMDATLKQGEKLQVKVCDKDNHQVIKQSEVCAEIAIKTALDQERLKTQLSKCKDTVFEIERLVIDMEEGITIPIKIINEVRRSALQALLAMRTLRPQKIFRQEYHRSIQIDQEDHTVVWLHQKDALDIIDSKKYMCFLEDRNADATIGYAGKRVMKHPYPKKPCLISEIGALFQVKTKMIATQYLNVTNSYAAAFLYAHGVDQIVLSTECDEEKTQALKEAFLKRYGCQGNFLSFVYGKEELMLMEYCPINYCEKDNDKTNCALCKGKFHYFLEDVHQRRYPLYGDEDCRMHLLSEHPHNSISSCNDAKLLVFYEETKDEIKTVLNAVNQ